MEFKDFEDLTDFKDFQDLQDGKSISITPFFNPNLQINCNFQNHSKMMN